MKKIIVPLDGSELAEQALPMATAIAKSQRAEIVLTTAIAVDDRWVNEEIRRQWEAEEEAGAESYLQKAAAQVQEQGVRVRTSAEWGRPHVVIEALADQEGADLIVLTTHGHSGVARWIVGSVADKVLRTTDTPLILIHPSPHAPAFEAVRRVAVALDGSEAAEEALPDAERIARALDASIVLVRAVSPPAALYGGEYVLGADVMEEMEAEATKYLEHTAKAVRARGFKVDAFVAVGVPAEVILAASRDDGPALVVMTTQGRSGLNRWVFGSVADAVVRHGDQPVLLIRPRVGRNEDEIEGVPVAINAVVPAPGMTETERRFPAVRQRPPEPRPHRPERTPGR